MTILWMTSEDHVVVYSVCGFNLLFFASDISGRAVKNLSRRTFEIASSRLAQEAKVIRKR